MLYLKSGGGKGCAGDCAGGLCGGVVRALGGLCGGVVREDPCRFHLSGVAL